MNKYTFTFNHGPKRQREMIVYAATEEGAKEKVTNALAERARSGPNFWDLKLKELKHAA